MWQEIGVLVLSIRLELTWYIIVGKTWMILSQRQVPRSEYRIRQKTYLKTVHASSLLWFISILTYFSTKRIINEAFEWRSFGGGYSFHVVVCLFFFCTFFFVYFFLRPPVPLSGRVFLSASRHFNHHYYHHPT